MLFIIQFLSKARWSLLDDFNLFNSCIYSSWKQGLLWEPKRAQQPKAGPGGSDLPRARGFSQDQDPRRRGRQIEVPSAPHAAALRLLSVSCSSRVCLIFLGLPQRCWEKLKYTFILASQMVFSFNSRYVSDVFFISDTQLGQVLGTVVLFPNPFSSSLPLSQTTGDLHGP